MIRTRRIISLAAAGAVSLAFGATTYADQHDKKADAKSQAMKEKDVVYFGQGAADLDWQAQQELDGVIEWAKENKNRKIFLVGHASEVGAADFNMELSMQRAQAAKKYLMANGIAANRITIDAMGEKKAVYAKQARNRRVVAYTTRSDESAASQQGQQQAGQEQAGMNQGNQPRGPEVVVVKDDAPEVVVVNPERQTQPAPQQTRQQADQEQQAQQPRHTIIRERTVVKVEDDDPTYGDDSFASRYGMAVSLGGGVMGFTNNDVRDFTDTGGTWEARATFGTRMPVGLEAAYVGSAQDINALGLDDSAVFVGNGAEAAVRVHVLPSALVQPYVFGGIGYTRYDVVNEDFNTSNVADNLDVGYIPVGLGVGFRYSGLLIDLRGTVRPAFGDELLETNADQGDDIPDFNIDNSNLTNWGATAKVGWEF